jgi:Holliday junction DNA helicase RuvA
MISAITGKILSKSEHGIVVMTQGGVGYFLLISKKRISNLRTDSNVELLTYLSVRENAVDLFGFEKENEREMFLKFLEVSGVGPKTALHLLSLGEVEEISSAIARGDLEYLTKVSGIGKKTAERIIVELKGKILEYKNYSIQSGAGLDSSIIGDTVAGLIALGYSASDAREIVKKLDASGKTSEQLLKEALKTIK